MPKGYKDVVYMDVEVIDTNKQPEEQAKNELAQTPFYEDNEDGSRVSAFGFLTAKTEPLEHNTMNIVALTVRMMLPKQTNLDYLQALNLIG